MAKAAQQGMPVVATNVVVLALNIFEAVSGGSLGKWSFVAMQGGFGLLFLTKAPDLVQDPFTFAKEGTDALLVGQELGWVVGFILCMHAVMASLGSPLNNVVAMAIVGAAMAKMAFVDSVALPAVSIGAAGVCMAVCVYDLVLGGSASSNSKKKD